MAKTIMVQGTMSNAGKSLLTAGLCRVFMQDGYTAAPFKSQNMSSNAHILPDGRRMSRAQAIQAEACGIEPNVLMNPVLLIPESDMGAQVIVNGVSRGNMSAKEYFEIKTTLKADIMDSFAKLSDEYDIVVIEGAGSPAEINLRDNDIVNMGLARMTDTPVILTGDINPGGVFAQLYGTVMLLSEEERSYIKGLIINKFRGDIELLRPGLPVLEEKCGVPCLGVLPYLDADFEPEDSLSELDKDARKMTAGERYDLLADSVRNNLDMTAIYKILQEGIKHNEGESFA